MYRDFITLSPEEQALIKQMEAKYPDMSFAPQPVGLARANEIRDFMRSHPGDTDAQRAALLSGGNWEGARMAYEAVCAAQNEFFIEYFEAHGLDYPRVPRDTHKSFINRLFSESEYSEVKTQRDEARAELNKLSALDAQRSKNMQYLLTMVDDLKLDVLMGRNNAAETMQKIDDIVRALTAHGLAGEKSKSKAKADGEGFGKVVQLTDEQILNKMKDRENRQADRQVDEMRERVQDAISHLRPAMPDSAQAARLLEDISRPYADFDDMFNNAFLPYLDSGAFAIGKISFLSLSAILHPFINIGSKLTPGSMATYFGKAIGDYRPNRER